MNPRKEGILLHQILRTMEELSAGFQKLGASKSRADSRALITAFIMEGWPREEAEAYAKMYFPDPSPL